MEVDKQICTCRDPASSETRLAHCSIPKCTNQFPVLIGSDTIMSECPIHSEDIQICTPPCNICPSCKEAGWEVDYEGDALNPPTFKLGKQCTCKIPNQVKNITCMACGTVSTVPKAHFEITASCPIHHSSIAICGMTAHVCEDCTKQGYKARGGFGFSPSTLYKGDVQIQVGYSNAYPNANGNPTQTNYDD